MRITTVIAGIMLWAIIYAVIIDMWREAFVILGLFVALMLLVGSKKG